ncbi:MAG: hypothetical protein FJX45_00995 [Alphaproteobacteria bacterium]|nr:hypothetical protein [Alphaproteobacteria bacterium]
MTDENHLPRFAFRVGVTGARKLLPSKIERLRHQINGVLTLVRDEIESLAETETARKIYERPREYALRVVSPLAEGADRRVAEEALALGYELYAPLPFRQDIYEQDFPETIEAFRSLLGRANVFELDGEPGNFAPESYREVGRFVVRNCDLLIALWDGEREEGPGGTAEIIRYAVATHIPVWRIDTLAREEPSFIDSPANLRSGGARTNAKERLKAYLKQALLPPEETHRAHGGLFAGFAGWLEKGFGGDGASSLNEYLSEQNPGSNILWRAYATMTWLISLQPSRKVPPLEPPRAPVEQWWDTHYRFADRLAIGQGDRYRSSYVWIAILAFVALAASALSTVLPHEIEQILIGAEVLAIAGIAFIVIAGHLQRWHDKWISYRLLAELCRKQYALSSIGRSLPPSEAIRASESSDAPRDVWVAWWFAVLQRAAPPLLGSLAAAKPDALRLALSLVGEQAAYHENCEARYEAASRRLERLGELFFLCAVVFAVSKTCAFLWNDPFWMGWTTALAICVSAASASFVGVRAYSEFALLARQSAQMRRAMTQARADLEAIDVHAPLAARELNRALHSLALVMLQDVGGWARLFRMKTLETA